MRILITGSSDGLGLLTARSLLTSHPSASIFAHARNSSRATATRAALPGAADVLIADLSTFAGINSLAAQIQGLAPFDAIIHNAGISNFAPYNATDDGYPSVFMVNVVAPYVLSCLCGTAAKRLVYVTSEVRAGAKAGVEGDFGWRGEEQKEGWEAKDGSFDGGRNYQAYASTKLWNVMFTGYFGRVLAEKGVLVNAVDPGWVATKMGGQYATGDLDGAVRTYVMLALGAGACQGQTGKVWHLEKLQEALTKSEGDVGLQEALVRKLEDVTNVKLGTA